MQNAIEKLPSWLLLLTGFVIVLGLGYLDFLTGDYSLLIFYAIPIGLEAWFLGRWGAALTSLAAGSARLISDYYSYAQGRFRVWNSLQDMLFLFMIGLLVAMVKKLLSEEERRLTK